MRFTNRRRIVFLFSFLLLSIGLYAQTSTTSVRGVVADQNGAVITGAAVTLHDPKTGLTRTDSTNANGEYQFVQVPPSTYDLTVKAKGFTTATQSIQLLVATPATVNVPMQVGSETTTVDVSGEAPLVNTQDATLGNAFSNIQVKALPLDARDPTELLSLQAGVTYVGNSNQIDQTFDSRNGAVQGARSDQSNVTLDGLDNNDQVNGFAFAGALRSTPDSLEEFRVTTTNANADAGRSSGAQVELVTKSGTNKLHGSLYELHRPTIGVANEWFNKQAQVVGGQPNIPPKFLRNNFGGSIGGPIIKDRLFFFFNYEALRKRESVQVTRSVPSEDLRHGIIHYVACNDGTPDCDPSAPTHIVTLTALDLQNMDPQNIGPSAVTTDYNTTANSGVLNLYPAPNTNIVGDGLNYQGFTFSSPNALNQNTAILKLDYNVTRDGNHRLFARGNLQDDTALGVQQFPGQPASTTERDNNKGIAVGYTALLGRNWVSNLRYGYIRQGNGIGGLSDQAFVHLRGLTDTQAFTRTSSVKVPVNNLLEDVTWTKGNHTIQFGGNWRRVDVEHYNNSNSFSTASTNPSWYAGSGVANTGQPFDPAASGFDPVASFWANNYDYPIGAVIGAVTEVDATYNRDRAGMTLPQGAYISRHWRSNEGEFYVQDTWRAKSNLTITGGLRYSLLQPPYEVNGLQVQPTVNVGDWYRTRWQDMLQGNVQNSRFDFNLSGKANGGKPYWAWDYKDIAPRLAFAYSPNFEHGPIHWLFGSNGKSSIRGGYGLYYDHFGEGIVGTFDQYGSFGLTTTITNPAGYVGTGDAPRMTSLYDIPASLTSPPPAEGWPATYPDAFAITWGLDDHLKTPYSHVFDFSITRELPGNYVFEAAYVGRFGHRLLQQDDIAMPLDLVDPKSGMDYFTAATLLAKAARSGVDMSTLANIPYWEDLFPQSAGVGLNAGCAVGSDTTYSTNYTATQNIYDLFACVPGNETFALFYLDTPDSNGLCYPSCSTVNGQTGPYHFYQPQFSSLYAWRSIGVSSYNGLELSLRHHGNSSLQFDINYTFSKSFDMGSDAERISWVSGPGGQIINTFAPRQLYSLSDFNAFHQLNGNWVWSVPYGRGKRFGSDTNRFVDAILGGWEFSGIVRLSSGFPFSVNNGAQWPTNWELGGNAVLVGKKPKIGVYNTVNGYPNAFADPVAAYNAFRVAYPGEAGQRNNLIGPGFFNTDVGLAKTWKITERQLLKFQWQVFNVTNSVRFDALTMAYNNGSLTNSSSFGNYTSTMTQYRRMQLGLRYEF